LRIGFSDVVAGGIGSIDSGRVRTGDFTIRFTNQLEVRMAGIEVKSVSSPEETRPFKDGKGEVHVVNVHGQPVLHGTFEPGWRWSEHVKPIAGTDSCQANHVLYCISGRMGIAMNDGSEAEIGPGDVVAIAPGHDAWVVGDEPCVSIDWGGIADYAKPS
jgi:quercetin dioxygenase-like cupin family protein